MNLKVTRKMPKYFSISTLALALFVVTFAVNLQVSLYSSYVGHNVLGVTAATTAFAGLSVRHGFKIGFAASLSIIANNGIYFTFGPLLASTVCCVKRRPKWISSTPQLTA